MKILLIFRSPVGGLFRHVKDLAAGLRREGHEIAIACDARAELDKDVETELNEIASLGVLRVPIARYPGIIDLFAIRKILKIHKAHKFDIVHGHGAKGGVFARMLKIISKINTIVVYTLHGGTTHYRKTSLVGMFYLWVERQLLKYTDGIIFESRYVQDQFFDLVKHPECTYGIIYNGLYEYEFTPVSKNNQKYDFIYLGELRWLKGVDVLLKAMHLIQSGGREVSLGIFGTGPDENTFKEIAKKLSIRNVRWLGTISNARSAFELGKCLVMPSRAESLSYVILEAAAMDFPVVATRVGGIDEIMGSNYPLVSSEDHKALAEMMLGFIDGKIELKSYRSSMLALPNKEFTVECMVSNIEKFYNSCLTK